MSPVNTFEEYKLFVEDTARLSDRRQTVTNTYIAVNSLLLGAISFLIRDAAGGRWWGLLLAFPLLVSGVIVCCFWRQFIIKYKTLIGLRIDTLRDMEDRPGMEGSVRMYHVEDAIYPRDEHGKMIPGRGLNFSDLEKRLPVLFLVLYVLYAAGVLMALAVMAVTALARCMGLM
ncbi:MAG: RipA family octameric membrane protein [Anaerolineae bacterium]